MSKKTFRLYGGKLFLEKKEMEPEILFSFVGLFFQIINPAKSLVNSISNIQSGKSTIANNLLANFYEGASG